MSTQNGIVVAVGVAFFALYVAQVSGSLSAETVDPLWNAGIAVFLVGLGAFGIENAKKFKLRFGDRFSVGIETERYEPTLKEEAQAIAVSQDALTPQQEQEAFELRRQAKARKESARSAADFLVLSTEAWRSENFDAATSLAQQGLSLGPTNGLAASLTQRMASAYDDLGATRHAEKLFRQAIALDPTLAVSHNNLGCLLLRIGRLDEAETETRKAISMDPDNAYQYANLGRVLERIGRLDEAETATRKAIQWTRAKRAITTIWGASWCESGAWMKRKPRLGRRSHWTRAKGAITTLWGTSWSESGAWMKRKPRLGRRSQWTRARRPIT